MENEIICDKLLIEASKDFEAYKSLPLAVYIKCATGLILDCNDNALELLELEGNQKGKVNIGVFYPESKERDRIRYKLQNNGRNEWTNNQILNYVVNGKKTVLRYFAKTYKDDEGLFLGTLCLAYRIPEFEKFGRLEEDMIPVGLFEVSEENIITYSNRKFREILKIKDNTQNISAKSFVENNNKYAELFKNLIKNRGIIKNSKIELQREDKTEFIGNLNLLVDDWNEDNKVIKTLGVLEDVTFNDIIDDFPIGLFRLQEINNNLKVIHCNKHFAQIFDRIEEDCKDTNFEDLINRDESNKDFRNKLDQLNKNEKTIKLEFLSINNDINKKEVFIQIGLLDKDKKKYGGTIYEVTDNIEAKLYSVRQDLAAFFHTSASVTHSVRSTIDSIISANGTNAVKASKVDIEVAFSNIKNHIKGFNTHYETYFQKASALGYFDDINREIELYQNRLAEKVNKEELSKVLISFIRNTFLSIRERLIDDLELIKNMPNESIKNVKNEIESVFRYTRLLSLHYIEYEMAMDYAEMEELKSALRHGSYIPEYKKFNLLHPLKDAIDNLSDLANRKQIEIKFFTSNYVNITAVGDSKDIYYAFYNVLNNAIKYSWFIKSDEFNKFDLEGKLIERKKYQIRIEIEEKDEKILIIFENKGVGISKNEIDSGHIFEFGNRGDSSSDYNRKGHGVGLWHTKKIITEFGGVIKITSDEEKSFIYNNQRRQLYNTRVTISLPKPK